MALNFFVFVQELVNQCFDVINYGHVVVVVAEGNLTIVEIENGETKLAAVCGK